MEKKKIGILVGSLRKESYNRKIAKALEAIAPESFDMEEVELGALTIYNQDLDDEGNPPQAWTDFRERIRKYDAFLFITPEYNRSVPALLKNALDVASKPLGKNSWGRRPAGVISVSPGALGGFGANHHLRQVLVCLRVPTMPSETYIGNAAALFHEDGTLADEITREHLQKFMRSFAVWVEKNAKTES